MWVFWLFAIPFLSAIAIAILPKKKFAFLLSLIPLGFLLANRSSAIGSEINFIWFPTLSINFHLSVDALSLIFLYLTFIIIPISILAQPINRSYSLIFVLQGLLIGFFTARDLALFTVFWEGMLLPLYFIINIWGKSRRQSASLKFLIYMIAGSALMVSAVVAIYLITGSFNMDVMIGSSYPTWIFVIFMLAFAVKTPLFPFHAWLPDTYYEAPVSGTILLSGILSKAGIYGVLRIIIPLFPDLLQHAKPILVALAITGVLYGAVNAWVQTDFKRLIAYSSFSHVNFILAGLFSWSTTAYSGAILQVFNHGITISALFLTSGWLEERLRSTEIRQAGGLAKYTPLLCWLTMVFVLSSVAVPGTNTFIGELLILFGVFAFNPWVAFALGLSLILSAVYMLKMMQKIYFEVPRQQPILDIGARELCIALPLVFLIFWIGIYPAPILSEIETIKVEMGK